MLEFDVTCSPSFHLCCYFPPPQGFCVADGSEPSALSPDGEIGAGNERCCCAQSPRLQEGGRLPTPVLVGSSEGALQEDEVDFCPSQRLDGICAAAPAPWSQQEPAQPCSWCPCSAHAFPAMLVSSFRGCVDVGFAPLGFYQILSCKAGKEWLLFSGLPLSPGDPEV